jgi:hypothetical protein
MGRSTRRGNVAMKCRTLLDYHIIDDKPVCGNAKIIFRIRDRTIQDFPDEPSGLPWDKFQLLPADGGRLSSQNTRHLPQFKR